MAKLEDLIKEISEPQLRGEISREVKKLKAETKFGLVFEEHLPEQVQLPSLPIKVGSRVVKRGKNNEEVYFVISKEGSKFRIKEENGVKDELAFAKELIVIKKFGESIYPTLVPVDRVVRAPEKPFHSIINADNYHALQLLLYGYEGKVDVIYIDPPFNTGARDWKYNNDYVDSADRFRHSKWLSMVKKRLSLAKRLLRPDGVLIMAIDDYEIFHAGCLLEEIFAGCKIETAVINHHPQGGGGENLSRTHEYALFCVPTKVSLFGKGVIKEMDEWPLMRTGTDRRNFRKGRRKQFYALIVEPKENKIIDVGPNLELGEDYPKGKTAEGYERAYPIDGEGRERVWRYNRTTMLKKLKENKIIITERGAFKVIVDRKGKHDPIFSNWVAKKYNAGVHGTTLLEKILGITDQFSYPKSLYTVIDCIAAVCRNKPNAVILDFFAGSGTTLHATCVLNEDVETLGNRSCILVTNNELEEETEKKLKKQRLYEGEKEFERHGICESVTWPRCKYVVEGQRDDGSKLSCTYHEDYLDGREFSLGFNENVEYFKLDFLDPNDVAYGEKFTSIVPILWLISGAKGKRETNKGKGKWFIPKNSPYAVLIDETAFAEFKKQIKSRPDIEYIYLVTDSEEAYREMIAELPGEPETKMLYKSYLENFRINTRANL